MEVCLSNSQKNVYYIFQLFLKYTAKELVPFVSCQNNVEESPLSVGCHQPPLFVGQVVFFFSISQSMFGKNKQTKTKKQAGLRTFHECCPQAWSLCEGKEIGKLRWNLDPIAAGKGMFGCPKH